MLNKSEYWRSNHIFGYPLWRWEDGSELKQFIKKSFLKQILFWEDANFTLVCSIIKGKENVSITDYCPLLLRPLKNITLKNNLTTTNAFPMD